ncbi:MAG: hypothetical protein A2087_12040 [Spirochaetes bacterium GWD1_61_31]|nr:MAG: hypothetical protein A2Y37_11135 [Spirochaetes bacterium GWB1_60_80]OHD35330.1 MAG: hypothetical protein A2004_00370 [Spirochaetes bacterium GWC1_61_12]OHD43672.1 MAG: hypothetical protein A2087_12040 [Spirochaetes bacterium GWD1_61_31]OHD44986.1 MAG: hypothetical protein A2Y35_13180 [Spirochaetes bacterium GWE1_60_18]OHD60095.1 MAG: hypothetical protein A2Y32_11290 [Spirochaetes bacterium GWF1_60_12]HAP43665.1 hypothetical protein [Spirochaetaceae bacterium]
MQNITFRQAGIEDIPLLVQNIIFVSLKPNSHCLHSWAGDSPADLTADFQAAFEAGEMFYILACSGPCIIGAMGGEFDPELERVWLHGPHVFAGAWSSLAPNLYEELLQILPPNATRWDAFLNVKNNNGIDFYRKHGYTQGTVTHDYQLNRSRRIDCPADACTKLTSLHHASFVTLFDQLFPDTYYSAQALLQLHGGSHCIYVVAEGERVLGFSVAALEDDAAKAEVQFIGIAETERNKGYGRQLLARAVDWLFDEKAATEIALTVEDSLTNARGLYESVGFMLNFSGLPLSKKKVKPLEL